MRGWINELNPHWCIQARNESIERRFFWPTFEMLCHGNNAEQRSLSGIFQTGLWEGCKLICLSAFWIASPWLNIKWRSLCSLIEIAKICRDVWATFGAPFFQESHQESGVPLPWRRCVTGAEQIVPIVRLVSMAAEDAGEEQVPRNVRSIIGWAGERLSVCLRWTQVNAETKWWTWFDELIFNEVPDHLSNYSQSQQWDFISKSTIHHAYSNETFWWGG